MSFPTQNPADLTVTGSKDVFIENRARPDTDVTIADAPDVDVRYLMVIDGKLQYQERSGRIYPMETLPEAFKQWLQHECGDKEKKEEYVEWLMDAPLHLNEDGPPSVAPFPPGTSLTLSRMHHILKASYECKKMVRQERRKHLTSAIWEDSSFWEIKKKIETYKRLIGKLEHRQDAASSRLP